MNLFNDFLIPLAMQTFVTMFVISAFAIFLYYKTIPDEKKRNKIITGYLFFTVAIFLGLIVMILSFA